MPKPVYDSSSNAYLSESDISTSLQNEFVQPCARAGFSQSLTDSSKLASLIAAGKGITTSVKGGNGRLVERFLRLSYAYLRLDSTVIALNPGKSCTTDIRSA